jgi:pyruvate formate lyase activating enzyme
MKIGGYQKRSLVDFPGKAAAVVYTQGCNWRCPYCHIRSLVIPARFQPATPESDIIELLEQSRGIIEGVVITGGEPTVQIGLASFLRRVRSMGYLVKLDTNGSRPAILAGLFNEGLLDYVALDVKGPLSCYSRFTGRNVDPGMIELSIELVRTSGVPYELRTTIVGGLHDIRDIQAIAPLVSGSARYALQAYRPPASNGLPVKNLTAPDPELFHVAGELLRDHVGEFVIRS